MENRNIIVDILKVIFAISIANSHFLGSFLDAGIIVIAFFVMSGYYLARTQELKRNQTTWNYTISRLKRIYPEYLIALMLLFFTIVVTEWEGFGSVASRIYDLLPEIMMLQNTGIFAGGINYPCWQVTTLLIVSHIMYSMLNCNKQVVRNVICPVTILMVYTFFNNTSLEAQKVNWEVLEGVFYMPLIRAWAGIALGVAIYEPICLIKKYVEKHYCKKLILRGDILALLCIVAFVVWNNRNIAIFLFVCIFAWTQIICSSDTVPHNRFLLKKLFSGGVSLHIYLFHAWFIKVFRLVLGNRLEHNCLLWTVVFDIVIVLWGVIIENGMRKSITRKMN